MKKDKSKISLYILIYSVGSVLLVWSVYLVITMHSLEKGRHVVTISTTTPKNIEIDIGKPVDPTVIASKNGQKYHFPWCASALRIKEESKIVFKDANEARRAGYEPAANCKGLE